MQNTFNLILLAVATGLLLIDAIIIWRRHSGLGARRRHTGMDRLFTGRFGIFLLLIGMAYFTTFAIIRHYDRDKAIDVFQRIFEMDHAHRIADNVEGEIRTIQTQLQATAQRDNIIHNAESGHRQIGRFFQFMDRELVHAVCQVTTAGVVSYVASDDTSLTKRLPEDSVFLQRVRQDRKEHISPPFGADYGFTPVVVVEPIFENKTHFRGWIAALVNLDNLVGRNVQMDPSGIASACLMDKNGVNLSDMHRDGSNLVANENLLDNPSIKDFTERLQRDEDGMCRFEYQPKGQSEPIKRAVAFARVHLGKGAFWVVGINAEESDILASIPMTSWPGITIAALFFLMIILVTIERLRDEYSYAEKLEHEIAIRMDDLRQSEGRFSTVLEQTTEAIFLTDSDGVIHYANPAFYALTGRFPEEVLGNDSRILLDGRRDRQVYRDILASMSEQRIWSGHYSNRRPDGTLYEVESVISPVRDASGKVIHYVSVSRDVTLEHALEAQLRQSQKMEAIGKLAGGVAHDFNNVLTAIVGNIQLAQRRGNEPVQKYLKDALVASERAAAMVRQLLTFSRKSSGVRQPVDLNLLIRETVRLVEKSIDRRIRVTTDLLVGLPEVPADPNQIHQVMMNLCVNARDALLDGMANAENGTARRDYQICVLSRVVVIGEDYCRLHSFAHPGAYVVITVGDNGVGMDKETLARIFEPFFTTKELGRGTGLGLSTVYGIVKSHNGWVHVDSKPGKGAQFMVYLPLPESASADQTTETPAHNQAENPAVEVAAVN